MCILEALSSEKELDVYKLVARVENKVRGTFWKLAGFPATYQDLYEYELANNFKYTRCLARAKLGYDLKLHSPKTFNEKSIHRRLFCRDEIWPIVADKVAVRDWLARNNFLGEVSLVPVRAIFSNPDDLRKVDLRSPAFLKAAWASGYNIKIASDTYSKLDSTVELLRGWKDEAYFPKRLAWAAEKMPRRFIVEEVLSGDSKSGLTDYKFYVFHGRVGLIQVISDREGGAKYSHFSRRLERIPIRRVGKLVGDHVLPSKIGDLIKAAENIGQHFDFARVDLYLQGKEIFFGEITQTPANGFAAFDPVSFDCELGELWSYEAKN